MLISDKQKKILTLLADGQFHSGTELAQTLGVSRPTIWKHVNALTVLGLQYCAVSGKGYRLDKPLELLEASKINAYLEDQTKSLIASLEIHDQIDSTNRYLMELAQQHAASGQVCFAEHQTAGKGRRGRQWVSPFGSNIYLSVLWRFQQGYASTAGLSLAIGVAVIRALHQHPIADVGLKWPNDIYSQGKKLGGILIEMAGETDGPCAAVIGLGLNLFLPEGEAQSITQAWTDLSKVTGQAPPERNRLAGNLLNQLLSVLREFESIGINAFLDEWRSYDCLKGRQATLFIAGQPFAGVVRGINDHGFLLLEQPDGKLQAFASGEVSFSPTAP
ncbi:MAG: bifunctional biotin--[acetyl-CoA-carboxylase] ligase/biotin operon repressor BirA [Methylovulum sp.]|nr:bifunctional biotin--[acetyl-CoA-carboxylase] ligase/biotin operon repressor BirA [Methylovulum sp.]